MNGIRGLPFDVAQGGEPVEREAENALHSHLSLAEGAKLRLTHVSGVGAHASLGVVCEFDLALHGVCQVAEQHDGAFELDALLGQSVDEAVIRKR